MTGSLLFINRIVVFFITFLLVANIPEYVNTLRIGLFPFHFYIVTITILLFLSLISKTVHRIPKPSFYVIGWFTALVAGCLISVLVVSRNGVAIGEINKIGMFAGMGASMALLLSNRDLLSSCGYGVLCAVIVCTALTYREFFDPNFNVMVDAFFETKIKEGVIQRSGGLHGNANANGYSITLGMFIAQYFIPKSFRLPLALFVGFAVFTTVSRSAMLLWMLVVLYGLWAGIYLGKNVVSKLFAVFAIAGLYLSLVFGLIPTFLESVGLDEYMNDGMLQRLSGDFFTQVDGSTSSRLDAATLASQQFVNNPIFGSGLGTARGIESEDVGAHNMILRIGAELGIVGVLIYLSLLLVPLLAKSRGGFVFVLFYFFLNFFTHTSFEKSVFAILLPMAIIYFSTLGMKKAKRRRKRRRKRTLNNRDNFQQVSA